MKITSDVYNLAYSCLIDSTGTHEPITLAEASYTLQCWQAEGSEIMETDGLTPEAFMMAWNEVLQQLRRVSSEHLIAWTEITASYDDQNRAN